MFLEKNEKIFSSIVEEVNQPHISKSEVTISLTNGIVMLRFKSKRVLFPLFVCVYMFGCHVQEIRDISGM